MRNNEIYRQISHLEEKLVELIRENKLLEEVINENRKINDYTEIRDKVEKKVNEINTILKEDRQELKKYTN